MSRDHINRFLNDVDIAFNNVNDDQKKLINEKRVEKSHYQRHIHFSCDSTRHKQNSEKNDRRLNIKFFD